MIRFGAVSLSEWTKEGASLPVLRLPLELDGRIVATVELWGDLRMRPDGSAYLTVGSAVGGFAVIEPEDLERIGFRTSMQMRSTRSKKGTAGS